MLEKQLGFLQINNNIDGSKSSNWIDVLNCIAFSIIYVFIPWESIGASFPDQQNYLERIEYLVVNPQILELRYNTLIDYFTGEVLWAYILFVLSILSIETKISFAVIIFISVFNYAYVLKRYTNWFLLIIVFYNPLVIELFLSQTRSAFAFSLVMIVLQSKKKIIQILIFFVAAFIHNVMYAVIIWWLFHQLIRILKIKIDWLFYTLVFGLVFNIIVYSANSFLVEISSRISAHGASSFLFTAIWIPPIVLLSIVLKRNTSSVNNFYYATFYFFSSIFLWSPFFDVYGRRYFVLVLPIILIIFSEIKFSNRTSIISLVFIISIIQYIYWLGV
jgi:hypothetical protein